MEKREVEEIRGHVRFRKDIPVHVPHVQRTPFRATPRALIAFSACFFQLHLIDGTISPEGVSRQIHAPSRYRCPGF